MSLITIPKRLFLITYDDGYSTQTLKVPVELYESDSNFQKNIISFKCLHCGVEFHYDCIEKESEN